MDPIRSSLLGGIGGALALLVSLLVAGLLVGETGLFVFSTVTSLCSIAGPPYCGLGTPAAAGLTLFMFLLLFAVAWPLVYAGFTWGLPGESGVVHRVVFGVVLWVGYLAVAWVAVWRGWETVGEEVPLLVVTLLAYVIYGAVLGGGYDYFAEHRTFLSGSPT